MRTWTGQDHVGRLMARGRFDRAARILEDDLARDPDAERPRLRLADALDQGGHAEAAVATLVPLVDRYTEDGFLHKAMAVLARIGRLSPRTAPTVERRIAALVARAREPRPTLALVRPEAAAPGHHVDPEAQDTAVVSIARSALRDSDLAEGHFHWSALFHGLSDAALRDLIGSLELIIKLPGAIIFTQDEAGDSLYVLAHGRARIYHRDIKGHHRPVAMIEEGTFFGVGSVLRGSPRVATVTAVTACELLELHRATFEILAKDHPRLRTLVREAEEAAREAGSIAV